MANNVLGTKITDLEEAQTEGLTDDALLIVEPETPPTKRSKLSTFFTWVKGKLAAWILSSYDEVMAATEAGYLVDALAVKDGFTQLNTNIATTKDSAIKVKTTYKAYSAPAGKTVYITPKDADFSGGTVLCAIPELVAASAGWDNTIISVGTSDDGKNIRLYSSVSQNLYVRVIFLYT